MNLENIIYSSSPINQDIVLYYEKIFKVILPLEVRKIISLESGNISYNDEEHMLFTPKEWKDYLDIFDFDFNKSGLVPLLFFDYTVVCYAPKEKGYLIKELGLGSETDEYKSIIELLDARDSIIEDDDDDIS